MHPVLKKIMPHTGTDFGAPSGTPVGASSYGTISFIGPAGPSGNLVKIEHPGTRGDEARTVPPFNDPAAHDGLYFQALNRGARSVTLDLRLAPEPVWVSADPQLLRVALSNLINNALDALSTRKQSAEPARIELGVEATAGRARLLVSDNGDGVPEQLRSRLFEPFQSGKASGVGIGLALGKRIAQAHGGDLELVSFALGARFCLSLLQENA